MYIRKTGTSRGRGVFTRQDLPRKHPVLLESPILTCRHGYIIGRRKFRDIDAVWTKLAVDKKQEIVNCFKKLKDVTIDGKLGSADKRTLEHFITEYGFRDSGNNMDAYIFKLACHINHACSKCANSIAIVSNETTCRITVRLQRDLEAHEELLINYGKTLPYRCAVCCPSRSKRTVKRFKHKLFALMKFWSND